MSDRSTALFQFLVQFASFGGRHRSQKKCRGMIRATRKKILYEQIRELTNRQAWTDPKLLKALRELEGYGLIKQSEQHGWSCISIIHYEEFVSAEFDGNQTKTNSPSRGKRVTAPSEIANSTFENDLANDEKHSNSRPKPLSKEGLKNVQQKDINGGSAELPPSFELVEKRFEDRYLKGEKCAHFTTAREFFEHKSKKQWRYTTDLDDDIDHWLVHGKAEGLIQEEKVFSPPNFLDAKCSSSSSMPGKFSACSQRGPSLEEVRTYAWESWNSVLLECELHAQQWHWRQCEKHWIYKESDNTISIAEDWKKHLSVFLDRMSKQPSGSKPS